MENEINEKQLDKKPTSWKKKLVIGLITALIVAVSFTLGFFTKVWTTSEKERIINWVINTIDEHYYCEEDGVIKDFTAEDYADAIIETLLDRYSNYYTAEEYTDAMNTSSGNYFGTGVKFLKDSETNALYGVSLNSPAYKAGLKAGDVIVEGKGVNGENKTLSTKTQVLEFIENQPQNSQFSLYYTRNGGEKQQVKVARQVFISAYVEYFDNEFKGEFLSEGATSPKLVSTPSNEKNYLGSGVGFIRLVEFHGDA